MKRIILLLMLLIFSVSCSNKVVTKTYTEKFEGLTQLILASETKNVNFVETIKKTALVFLTSDAKVEVNSSVTFDFYLDFEKDPYHIDFDQKNKILNVSAPPIRVKKPVINNSTVSYPDRGIFVNEDREAVQILESLTDRFMSEGEVLLKEQYVMDKCREKAIEFFTDLCKEMSLNVKSINMSFPEISH